MCLAIYVVISVLFTTCTLLSSSSRASKSIPQPSHLSWPNSTFGKQILLDSKTLGSHSIEESIILSKAFPHLMKPSQIIPYYYYASGTFDKEDITITSLITSNRFQTLERLVERYQGTLFTLPTTCIPSNIVHPHPAPSRAYTHPRSNIGNAPYQQRNRKCPPTSRIAAPSLHEHSQHGKIRRRPPCIRHIRQTIQHLEERCEVVRKNGVCYDARRGFLPVHTAV